MCSARAMHLNTSVSGRQAHDAAAVVGAEEHGGLSGPVGVSVHMAPHLTLVAVATRCTPLGSFPCVAHSQRLDGI